MRIFLLSIFILYSLAAVSNAEECAINVINHAEENEIVRSEIKISNVKGLAGLKFVMSYPSDAYAFKEMTKSKETAAFLNVVNDKVQGQLIVVMASANGISGKDFALMSLYLLRKNRTMDGGDTVLSFEHIELMGEDLKAISCRAN